MNAAVPALLPPRDRRPVGLAVTIAVHALLLLGWQMTRRLPVTVAPDPVRTTIQWIRLPAPPARPQPRRDDEARPQAVRVPAHGPAPAITLLPPPAIPAAPPATAAPATPGSSAPAPAGTADAAALLERARRDAGAVDRALRKENNPYIVAPLDSPQIRMRKKMEAANAMAPNRLWEAPKIEELVNDTGDGARRSRVITGSGTYCVTERAPTASVDTIEKHGKIRISDCGSGHEQPATSQEWRTARD